MVLVGRKRCWAMPSSGGGGTALQLIAGGGEDREGARPVASCPLSLTPPSNSRPVLQSINPAEPHTECPNPKPGSQSGPAGAPVC